MHTGRAWQYSYKRFPLYYSFLPCLFPFGPSKISHLVNGVNVLIKDLNKVSRNGVEDEIARHIRYIIRVFHIFLGSAFESIESSYNGLGKKKVS